MSDVVDESMQRHEEEQSNEDEQSDEDEQSEQDEVDKRNAELVKKMRKPVYSLEARREMAARARFAFSPAKEINRKRGYFEAIVATAADDSKKSADEGDAAGSSTGLGGRGPGSSSSAENGAGSIHPGCNGAAVVNSDAKGACESVPASDEDSNNEDYIEEVEASEYELLVDGRTKRYKVALPMLLVCSGLSLIWPKADWFWCTVEGGDREFGCGGWRSPS